MQAFDELMELRGLTPPDPDEIIIEGSDPVHSTPFRIAETCASVLAAIGVAASDLWELRTGERQRSRVSVRHAGASLRSTHYLQRQVDAGFEVVESPSMVHMASITQPWPTRDGRWFLPHFNLPNLRDRVLSVLECEATPGSVAAAVARRDALELEEAIARVRACGAMVRSHEEWMSHPHGQALAARPVVEIERIGDAPPRPLPDGPRPLSGTRVLDLTRILAGPVAARTLAEQGAEVLMVTGEHLPQVHEHVIDTSHGKRSCFLDLREEAGRDRLRSLIRQADVFSQGYRPGVMQRHGFTPEALAAMRPGLIYLSVSCYGAAGPFAERAGWEQLAQTVSGLCHGQSPERPSLIPATPCDYTTGYLGALGVLLALGRRAREGGSYHVRVSLCQSALLVHRQGRIEGVPPGLAFDEAELDGLREERDTVHGRIRFLRPVLQMSQTPPRWERTTPTLGGDESRWLEA